MRPPRATPQHRPAAGRALLAAAFVVLAGAAVLPQGDVRRSRTARAQGPSATPMKVCEIQDTITTMSPEFTAEGSETSASAAKR